MQPFSGEFLRSGHKSGYGRDRGSREARLRLVATREQEIIALREQGHTLAAIGQQFGISRQRVEQIIRDAGGAEIDRVRSRALREREIAERHALHRELAAAQAPEILARYRDGEDLQAIARELGIQNKALKALVKERRSEADIEARAEVRDGRRPPQYSDAELIDCVRLAARHLGHVPTHDEYDAVARELRLAATATVCMRFERWNRAVQAAGLEPAARSPMRVPRWHLAACWNALTSVADQLGEPPRYRRYLELAAGRDDLPSAATLRQRLGLWSEIAAALELYRRNRLMAGRQSGHQEAAA